MSKLQIGDVAPELTGVDQDGKDVRLADYKGRKVILYFYPKDNTPGCTAESCNLRDHYEMLGKKGFDVIGVSADSEKKHRNFISKYDLPFRLLSDPDKVDIRAYDVWGLKKFMGREFEGIRRTTFVINEEGRIEQKFEKVKTKTHTEQILASYES